MCYGLGICVGYSIFLGDFWSSLAERAGAGAWATKHVCMTAAVLGICYPLSCAPSLGGLRGMSLVGTLSVFFALVAVTKRYVDGSYDDTPGHNDFELLNRADFGKCFPILVGALGAHYNVPTLFKEVAPEGGQAGVRRMTGVIAASVTVSTLIFGFTGFFVYATFGPDTVSDFVQNYDSKDTWLVAVRLVMTFAVSSTFPLTMVSSRNAIFSLALQPAGWTMTRGVRLASTTGLTAFCLGTALLARNIGVVLDYNGAVFGTPVCYIAPPAMYLCLPRSAQTAKFRALSIVCAALGVVFGIMGVVVVSMEI